MTIVMILVTTRIEARKHRGGLRDRNDSTFRREDRKNGLGISGLMRGFMGMTKL